MINRVAFKGIYQYDNISNPQLRDGYGLYDIDGKITLATNLPIECEEFCIPQKPTPQSPLKFFYKFLHTVVAPDSFDEVIENIFKSKGVNYKRLDNSNIYSYEGIKGRMRLTEYQKERNCDIVDVKTDKFDELFQKYGFSYLDKDECENPSKNSRYKGMLRYFNSFRTIEPSTVHVIDKGDYPEINFDDGRHRYAVMREKGLEKIPVAMNKQSQEVALKYGLI